VRYLSLFSGIEAASVAWEGLKWECAGVVEIDTFASEVLKKHYPQVKNYGDITKITKEDLNEMGTVELVVGGSPCQSFSSAGLRKGLEDPRGNLMLEYIRIIDSLRPKWFIWENVPGVLSSDKGTAFGSLIGAMVELGYSCCWRVLDAQHFGVPQRRRRVFVVGHLDSQSSPFQVLFEQGSSGGDTEESEGQGKDSPIEAQESSTSDGGIKESVYLPSGTRLAHTRIEHSISPCVLASWHKSGDSVPLKIDDLPVLESNQANLQISWNISPTLVASMGKGGGYVPMIPVRGTFSETGRNLVGSLCARDSKGVGNEYFEAGKVVVEETVVCDVYNHSVADKISPTLTSATGITNGSGPKAITPHLKVRRLTPVECERLQGFPDNWTRIKWRGKEEEHCPLGHRYRCLGNTMAVPVMRWIGQRINQVHTQNQGVSDETHTRSSHYQKGCG
jgi:DNA (cytosine-5)-methyltransferase 1